jgi:hypothetical protein
MTLAIQCSGSAAALGDLDELAKIFGFAPPSLLSQATQFPAIRCPGNRDEPPHTVEIDTDGFGLRVGNRGFVWSYPEHVPGQRRAIRADIAVLYVGGEEEKQARC